MFVPLMIANSILLEAGLSYLGAGVQPPNASWGTMISSGVEYITKLAISCAGPRYHLDSRGAGHQRVR